MSCAAAAAANPRAETNEGKIQFNSVDVMLKALESRLRLHTLQRFTHAAIRLRVIETRDVEVRLRVCHCQPAHLRRRAMQGEPCATHGQPLAPPPPPSHRVNAPQSALPMRHRHAAAQKSALRALISVAARALYLSAVTSRRHARRRSITS